MNATTHTIEQADVPRAATRLREIAGELHTLEGEISELMHALGAQQADTEPAGDLSAAAGAIERAVAQVTREQQSDAGAERARAMFAGAADA